MKSVKNFLKCILITFIALFVFKAVVYKLPVFIAEINFNSYLKEHNIEKSEIIDYSANKTFILQNPYIYVTYSGEEGARYRYDYSVLYFFDNRPSDVHIIKNSRFYSVEEYCHAGYEPEYPVETRQ